MNSDGYRQKVRQNPFDFTWDRSLPLPHLILLMLNYHKGTVHDELDQFFETVSESPTAPSVSPATFCKARHKLKPKAFELLNETLLESTVKHLPQHRWHGYRLLVVMFATATQWLVDDRHRQRRRTYRVNFANALSKIKNNIVRIFFSTHDWYLCWQLIQKVGSSVESIRPDRSYPRKMRKVKVSGFEENYKRSR